MKEIRNIIIRELKSIFSSRLYVLALLVFPILGCLFLGGIYSSGFLVKLPAAVIDNDNTKISRTIIRYFDASPDIEIKYRISNIEELKDLFAKQKAVMGIYIPKDIQKNIKRQKPQNIPVFVNSANYISGNIVEVDANTIITTIGGGIKYKTLVKRGFSSKQARELLLPVKNSSAKLFNPSLNYNIFLTPGIWMSVIQQLLILAGVLSISIEFDLKTVKTMMRSCKKNVFKAMTGKLAVYMVFSYLHFEILYRILFRIFGIPIISSVAAATALSICFAFAAVSLGMLLSSVLRTTSNALKGCLIIAAPAFLLSGYTWPPEQIPTALRAFAQLIPLTPFLEGFKKIYVQGLGMEFVMPYAKRLILYGIVFFISAYFITSARVKNAGRAK
ncbi:MAG: ABC transporter permease [Endomicrobium sp.]|jgi:ABC-2 type transport system permease protein|nr:ABC transporter permease [Endomicrobium sp.]